MEVYKEHYTFCTFQASLNVKYGMINLRITFHLNAILHFSSQMQRSEAVLDNSFPIFFGKKIHYSILTHSSVQKICIFS